MGCHPAPLQNPLAEYGEAHVLNAPLIRGRVLRSVFCAILKAPFKGPGCFKNERWARGVVFQMSGGATAY